MKTIGKTLNPNDVIVDPHAVRRFTERWRPDLLFAEGKKVFQSALTRAVYKGPTLGGELWYAEGDIPFVLRRDPKVGPVIVTVLPSRAIAIEEDELLDVVAAYQRATADGAPEQQSNIKRRTLGIAKGWIDLELGRLNAMAAKDARQKAHEERLALSVAKNKAVARMRGVEADRKQLKAALKIAMTALLDRADDPEISGVVAAINAIDSAYSTPEFLGSASTLPAGSDA